MAKEPNERTFITEMNAVYGAALMLLKAYGIVLPPDAAIAIGVILNVALRTANKKGWI